MESTGDFNNDGQTDLFWRHYPSGTNVIWYMNNGDRVSGKNTLAVADANWKMEGVLKNSNPSLPDGVGNDQATALDIGTLNSSGTFKDSVGGTDTDDYYKFKLDVGSTVNLGLNGLSADANLRLLTSDGKVIQGSNNSGTAAESISRQLDPGTYYIQVSSNPGMAGSSYTLSASATATLLADTSLYWTRQLGTSKEDYSHDIAVDALGNVYVVGSTAGTIGTANLGDQDAFVTKYDSAGNRVWTRQMGGIGGDEFRSVAIDGTGNIVVGGWVDLNTPDLPNGKSWLVKLDANGNQKWSTKFGSGTFVKDIRFGTSGNIITSTTNNINSFNSDGILQGTFSALGTLSGNTSLASSMDVDSSGNIFVSGYTTPAPASPNYDIWVAKYSAAGVQQWLRQFGTSESEGSYSTKVDNAGNIYIGGWTFASLAGQNPDQSTDAWIAKYDTNGNRLWIKQSNNPGIDETKDLALDNQGNIFSIGYSTYPLVSKYASDGTLAWTKKITAAGRTGSVRPEALFVDSSGNLYTSGYSDAALEGTFAGGVYDAWVIKYKVDQVRGSIFNSTYGYGLVNAAAAVAQSLGVPTFADVKDLGGNNWQDDLVNAPEVWARGYTGQGVTVAVIDTGVDITHPDLAANIWRNTREIANNGIDEDRNGYIDDINGWNFGADEYGNNVMPGSSSILGNDHGTHVAGTIAGLNNGVGVTGVAPNAKIMSVKLSSIKPNGSMNGDLNAAIRYAVDNGARVINMSIGTGDYSALKDAIAYAASRGVITVSAAGNSYAPTPGYPAAYANQYGIAVGAVDRNRTIANFSNRAGSDSNMQYVVAPGVEVYSTIPGNSYGVKQGTSMATPNVAGVIALMLSANPNLTVSQVRQILTNSTIGLNFSSLNIQTTGTVNDLVVF